MFWKIEKIKSQASIDFRLRYLWFISSNNQEIHVLSPIKSFVNSFGVEMSPKSRAERCSRENLSR
jgi:hypothetical protein